MNDFLSMQVAINNRYPAANSIYPNPLDRATRCMTAGSDNFCPFKNVLEARLKIQIRIFVFEIVLFGRYYTVGK